MIIHIDASRALDPQPTGVNVYAQEIIDHIARLDTEDTIILYACAWNEQHAAHVFPELQKNCSWKFLAWPPKFLWTQLCLAWHWRGVPKKDAVFFTPAHVAPFFSPRNTVVTIHDVAYDIFPDAYWWGERMFARIMTQRMVSRSRHILVPSVETREKLIEFYGASSEKITVTHLALPCALRESVPETTDVLERYKLTKPLVLFVGRIEYKKGIDFLLAAFSELRKTIDAQLVLVGKPGIGYEAVSEAIAAAPGVRQLGFVPTEDLNALYSNAAVYALPSRYEGFGINILEAFQKKCPLVATRAGSIPEVAGEAAEYAETPAAFGAALARVISDPVYSQKLKDAGTQRLSQFDWDATALKTLTILHSAI